MTRDGADAASGSRRRPWELLPRSVLAVMEPLQPAISDEIVETLAREIPAYTRPLSGEFGKSVRLGVEQALEQFAELIGSSAEPRTERRRLYEQLGRGELRAGRSIGALLAAYRLGAQVAWRRLAAAGLAGGLRQETLNLLAESIFAYIDELSAESAEGYAREQADQAGIRDMRRNDLIMLLLGGGRGLNEHALTTAANAATWTLPQSLAVVVWKEADGREPALRLPAGSIVTSHEGRFCAVVPDLIGPQRATTTKAAFKNIAAGQGPSVAPLAAPRSFELALAALDLAQSKRRSELVAADRHRTEILCRDNHQLVAEIATERLAPLAALTPAARARLGDTLLSWLKHNATIPEVASELHVHPQTVRYRIARLREMLGDTLDDPDARFEIEFALRASVSDPETSPAGAR